MTYNNLHLDELEIHVPNEDVFSRYESVESCFRHGGMHTVHRRDRNIGEPVSFGSYLPAAKLDGGYDEYTDWLLRVKNGKPPEFERAAELLSPYINPGTLVIPVPSSKTGKVNGISKVARLLGSKYGMIDGSSVLVRTVDVEAQHKSENKRSKDRHTNSIQLKPIENFEEQQILLLDDIFTSGVTMSACRDLLEGAGATDITCAALGRTS